MEGVWIEGVTHRVMTLRGFAMVVPLFPISRSACGAGQGHRVAVAPGLSLGDPLLRQGGASASRPAARTAFMSQGLLLGRRQPLEQRLVAFDVLADALRRVEVGGLEGPMMDQRGAEPPTSAVRSRAET